MAERVLCEFLKIGRPYEVPRALCKQLYLSITFSSNLPNPGIKTLPDCPFRAERDESCGVTVQRPVNNAIRSRITPTLVE